MVLQGNWHLSIIVGWLFRELKHKNIFASNQMNLYTVSHVIFFVALSCSYVCLSIRFVVHYSFQLVYKSV